MTGSFFIFRDEIQCVLKKGLFLSWAVEVVIWAVRAVCQDPSARQSSKAYAIFLSPFLIPSMVMANV